MALPAMAGLAAAVLAAALAATRVAAVSATLVASTTSPGNSLATGTSAWFALNGTGGALCAGANSALACDYGTQRKNGVTVAATLVIQLKATGSYTLTVQNGTGPANLTTIVTAFFRSTNTTTATLAAGSADTIELDLKLKGGTPIGTYTGTLLITETATGSTATIPISVTRG